ncbi:uncharacterized protein LOC134460215 [Engraulis encrasicolus]|uniref:uncharacterized protein LOC134460215 n=1 Tax=Engraulis encrasicolus TaxID=184585 RepID=UPI002FD7287C
MANGSPVKEKTERDIFSDLKGCEDLQQCVLQKEEDFRGFLAHIVGQKLKDRLVAAWDLSSNYGSKVLLLLDEDRRTLQKAEEEYREDPGNTVKVGAACLPACLSKIHRDTVVRIFGQTSGNSDQLSTYSGSSLADMLLETDLKSAGLFSIDGNTSTVFQMNFMRAFKMREVTTVLEANRQFQVLNQGDSAVKFSPKSSARGTDRTTRYDAQTILIMEDNPVVRQAATYLYDKHPTVSSVYMLDQNNQPKLIRGDGDALSAESRLVLVGHGVKGSDGEMKVAGKGAPELADIISRMDRLGENIKTTSIVACEVGSDEAFIITLLQELKAKSIITELHGRSSVLEVSNAGEKVTVEITPDGLVKRHKDDSKKVIAWLTENGDVAIKTQSNSRGREIFSNERNFLGGDQSNQEFRPYVDQNARKPHTDVLESLAWGFLADKVKLDVSILKSKLKTHQLSQNNEYVYKVEGKRCAEGNGIKMKKGSKIYEIKSNDDILNLIAFFGKNGDKGHFSYLMLNDWIYWIDTNNLYVYPVGKKLNNNEKSSINKKEIITNIEKCITDQKGKESYHNILREIQNIGEISYGKYARHTFQGDFSTVKLPPSTEAWYSTYFLASVISESARNFRTLPLISMAMEMSGNSNERISEHGLKLLLAEHPMARPGSWINSPDRGFAGSISTAKDIKYTSDGKPIRKLDIKKLIELEGKVYNEWLSSLGKDTFTPDMGQKLMNNLLNQANPQAESQPVGTFKEAYRKFTDNNDQRQYSGGLGGASDGPVTRQAVDTHADVEHSMKLTSQFSRSSTMLSQEINTHLQKQFGASLGEYRVKPDSIRVVDGEFYFEEVSKANPDDKFSSKVTLSEEGQMHMEKIKDSMRSLSDDALPQAGKTKKGSDHLHRTGVALGVMGLMVGAQGAVKAFERGDIKEGAIGTAQTVHGVTGLSLAMLGKQLEVTKSVKVFKAIKTVLRNPVTKFATRAMPVIGIGFGIYSIYEDIKRGDTLGYIDAAIDSVMLVLDVVEIAVPVLAPIIVPLNLAISAFRMLFDDVYLSIESELSNLPPDAGVLDKIGAFFRGLGKGYLHFVLDILSFFFTIPHREIEEGRRLVQEISDYHKYYTIREVQAGRQAIDFTGGDMSRYGGAITFCLSDYGSSTFCMDKFVSSKYSLGHKCWDIHTGTTQDIVLGVGESHQLQYSTIHLKVLLFIPAGSIDVVSGYEAIPDTRYGTYTGNNKDNNFFAVQANDNKDDMQFMLSYYYKLYGKSGNDIFFLGPQRSYVEGQGGRDTYIIPKVGGNTVINNYDPEQTKDLLVFNVNYDQLSVSKSGDDVILSFTNSHNVRILNWFIGEEYRHMHMMSEDGVSFGISNLVVSTVKLIAHSIDMTSKDTDQTVDASRPPLHTVTNIIGSKHNDQLTGNRENNFLDGGGGSDTLRGKEGEDVYIIKKRQNAAVSIENFSNDLKEDMVILAAAIRDLIVRVNGDHLVLLIQSHPSSSSITLLNWFRSEADRHLVFLTDDFITFTVSADRRACMKSNPYENKCIIIQVLDYSKSKTSLQVNLERDEVYQSVTEVRGSDLDDNIKGNGQNNIIVPGRGADVLQGRGGADWYIISPGDGLKTIDNYASDLAIDMLYIKQQYKLIKCRCAGEDLQLLVNGAQQVLLRRWFASSMSQHLHVSTSDGVTFNLPSSSSTCHMLNALAHDEDFKAQMDVQIFNTISAKMVTWGIRESVLVEPCVHEIEERDGVLEIQCRAAPKGIVFRSGFPGREKFAALGCPHADQPFFSSGSMWRQREIFSMVCRYSLALKFPLTVDKRQQTVDANMMMNEGEFVSVLDLFGSSGFDDMTGNAKDNTLDPYKGGGVMVGLEGRDTYVVKSEYGPRVEIDNRADDMMDDTVLFQADFFSGGINVSSEGNNVLVSGKYKGRDTAVRLLYYHRGEKQRHLVFHSSDGVHFRLDYDPDSGPDTLTIKAVKIKMADEQTDCLLNLNAHTNLSSVHTVQGCPQQANSIEGNKLDNALTGGFKMDMMDGGAGHDTLMGGQGNDVLLGGSGDDTLYGEDGNDTMLGGSGADAFIPGPGADLVDGGMGRDTVYYQGDHEKAEGVYVNLLSGECRGADAEGDVLKDVENVVGTIYSDILVSGIEPALLKGSDGRDVLVSQAGGDLLIGGDGSDVYMLVSSRSAVIIDNCADDNATDVLYLRSVSLDSVTCVQSNSSLHLTFRPDDSETDVEVELDSWVDGGNACRHLVLMLRDEEVTVETLQHKCQHQNGEAI